MCSSVLLIHRSIYPNSQKVPSVMIMMMVYDDNDYDGDYDYKC
jgi:hypothetical protein